MKRYLAGLLMILSASSHATYYTGNDLLDKMKTSRSFALGYIAGVADENDGSLFVVMGGAIPSYVSCIPEGVILGQVADVVERYLVANPAIRHYNGNVLVNNALSSTWPCKKKN